MDEKGIKHTENRESNVEPLVWLPQSSVAIFPDKMIQYAKNRGKTLSSGNLTMPSLVDLEETDLVISFTKSDIAFKIQEELKRVKILKIKNQKVELEFQVAKHSQLIVVQEILRRKLCELGFEEKFTIIKELGKGATAKVYCVERNSDKKKFAAKIMSLKVTDNKDYQTFVNESKILKCLKNPYIVAIESLYISKKELISVLEYLEGGTLLEQLKNDMVKTNKQKIKVIADITEGVQHLRQKRIAHRDLKLQNIMVRINKDQTKDYVITDFGLACWIGEKDLLFQKCGTPGYIAPEILKANKSKVIVSHVSDIFSIGVIAHFVFLLRAVFPYNGDPKELLMCNKKAVFSLQTKFHLQLMSSQLRLLQKALCLDVDKRPNSRDLLDIYIKACERDAIAQEMKKKLQPNSQRKEQQESVSSITSTRKNILRISNSIEAIEKKQASVQKKLFPSQRNKTEGNPQSQRKSEKKQGSVGKLLASVWTKITSARSQELKKKAEPKDRKKQMKTFIKPD